MAQLTVCLTFDFDATSLWIANKKDTTEVSRGEFGAVAIERILRLLERLDVSATFFVPGHTVLAYPSISRRIAERGHEIALHGWVHETLRGLKRSREEALLKKTIAILGEGTGFEPRGYRASGEHFTDHTIDLLLEQGIVYDASCSGSDFSAYYLRRGDSWSPTGPYLFGEPTALVEIPFAWALDDFPFFEFWPGWGHRLASPSEVERLWREEFDLAYACAPGGVFDLTMHPQCIGRWPRLAMLERLIRHMSSSDGVVFETMLGYALAWRESNPLDRWAAENAELIGRA